MSRFVVGVGVGVLTLVVLAGCGGGGSSSGGATERAGTLTVRVVDVTDMPISGAVVDVTVKGVERRATTGPDGTAEIADLPIGEFAITVSADGFDSVATTDTIGSGPKNTQWTLRSDREWSAGWGIVLGSRVIERAGDDSAMTFSVDLAVVGETSDAVETLTAAQFSIVPGGGCGGEEWGSGGHLGCAYEAGIIPGYSEDDGSPISPDGGVLDFEWVPPAGRHPYLVGVLVQRGDYSYGLDQKVAALQTFFATLGGNDIAGLASVQVENGTATFTELVPFTSDGSTYVPAIDGIASPIGGEPTMAGGLSEYIRQVAAADADGTPGIERSVVVLARNAFNEVFSEATELARSAGIPVSHVGDVDLAGFREVAASTGGFMADSNHRDPRAYGMVLGAMDAVLSGSMPFYRIAFRITGEAGTFVSGRIVTLLVHVDVPTPFPDDGFGVAVDILIP